MALLRGSWKVNLSAKKLAALDSGVETDALFPRVERGIYVEMIRS